MSTEGLKSLIITSCPGKQNQYSEEKSTDFSRSLQPKPSNVLVSTASGIFSSGQAQETWLPHVHESVSFPSKLTKSTPHSKRLTYITHEKCILAGSDKIWMVRRQGVPVPGF